MPFRRALAFLSALCWFAAFAHAQVRESNCTIAGLVRYAPDQEPARQVVVKLQAMGGMGQQTITDARGHFEFSRLAPDTFEVEVSQDGYKPVRVRADLNYWDCHGYSITILLQRETETTPTASGDTVPLRELEIPRSARKAFEKGMRELNEKKRPGRSLLHFRQAIELYPDYDEAYIQLSVAHIDLDQYPEAQQVLEKATEVNPNNPRPYTLLGIVYRRQRQVKKAILALREAVNLDGEGWLAHFELGKSLLEARHIDEAYQHAQQAHRLHAQSPSVHLLRYNLCLLRSDYQAALAELDEFLELHPRNPWAAGLRQRRNVLRESLAAAADKAN